MVQPAILGSKKFASSAHNTCSQTCNLDYECIKSTDSF